MKVVAVVLNWKRAEDTITCIRSLIETSPETGIIVVDNASGDGSAEKIRAAFPGIALIQNERNLGYAGGNDTGIRAALDQGADAVLLLNNDIIVEADCVRVLTAALRAGAGIAGPLSLLPDGRVDFHVASVDVRNMAVHAHGRDDAWRGADLPEQTDYVTGSAMLIRASLLHTIGGFDERYFLVWEDVDLCFRARAAGARCLVVPQARVTHRRSASFGGDDSPLFKYFFVRNSFLFLAAHGAWWWKRRSRRMLMNRYRGWLDQPQTTPAMRVAIARGLADGMAGTFGAAPQDLLDALGR